ncbi:MAG: hypothetical protein ACFE7E_08960 [Candidatus Hodarchaeota archaeon]
MRIDRFGGLNCFCLTTGSSLCEDVWCIPSVSENESSKRLIIGETKAIEMRRKRFK